jgi:hypothetical protein
MPKTLNTLTAMYVSVSVCILISINVCMYVCALYVYCMYVCMYVKWLCTSGDVTLPRRSAR